MKIAQNLTRWTLACTATLTMAFAHGAWDIQPEISAEAGVDDNIRLTRANEEDGNIYTADANVNFRNVQERSNFSARVGVSRTEYSGSSLNGHTTPYLRLRAERNNERVGYGISASGRRDSLLRHAQVDLIEADLLDGAVNVGDPDLPPDVDRGAVEAEATREFYTISPYFNWSINQRTNLTLSYTFQDTQYDRTGRALGLIDTQYQSVNAGLTRAMSERDTLSLSVGVGETDPDGPDKTDTEELLVGWTRRATERTSFTIEVGTRRAEAANGEKDTGLAYRANVTSRLTNGYLYASAARTNWPTGFGGVSTLDDFELGWVHQFNQRWSSVTRAEYDSTDSSSRALNTSDRDYGEASQGFYYRMSETWTVGARARYRWVDRNQFGSASGLGFFVSISYRPLSEF